MRVVNYPKSKVEVAQAEEGFVPGGWWRALDAEGNVIAETGTRSDFEPGSMIYDEISKEGVVFLRVYERVERKMVEEHPFPKEEDLA